MSVKLSVAQKATVVPIGTKDFLPIQDPTSPPGEPRWLAMPPGVRIRSKKCVEINFTYDGATHFERLRNILPTVGGVLEAAAFRESVLTMIANNRFRYSQMFPDSLLVKRARETEEARQAAIKGQPEMLTIGEALDAWLVLNWASFSPNTREDYVRIVRTDLKALDLTSLELGQDAFLSGRHSGSQPRFAGFALNSGTLDERTTEIPKTSTVPSVLLQLDVPLEPDEEPSTRRRRKASALRKKGDAEGAAKAMTTKTIWERQAIALHGSELALLRVDELTHERLAHVRDLMVASTPKTHTVNNRLAPLRQALQLLVPKLIEVNPFDSLSPLTQSELEVGPRVEDDADGQDIPADQDVNEAHDEDDIDPFDSDEIERIVRHLGAEMRRYATFNYQTGLRTGEMIGLRKSDLDLEQRRVLVRRSQSRGKLKKTKTTKKRWVDLNDLAMATVKAQLEYLGEEDGWLFPNPFTGDQWSGASKIAKRWEKACRLAGVRYRRPYQLRHSYASMMLSAGEHVDLLDFFEPIIPIKRLGLGWVDVAA